MNKAIAWILGSLAVASVGVWGIVGAAYYLDANNKSISDLLPTHMVQEATASLFTGQADFIGTWENLNGKGETIDLYESGAIVRKKDPNDKNGWITGIYKIDGNKIEIQFADGTSYSTELDYEKGTMTWEGDVEGGTAINWNKTKDMPDDHYIVKATEDGVLIQNVEELALADDPNENISTEENPYGEPDEYETTEIISYETDTGVPVKTPTNPNEHDGYIYNSKGQIVSRISDNNPTNTNQQTYPDTVKNQPAKISQEEIDEAEANGMMNIQEADLQEDTPIVPVPYYTGYNTDSFNTPLYEEAMDSPGYTNTQEQMYPERYYDTDTYASEEATPLSMRDINDSNFVWGVLNEENDAVQEAIYDGANPEQAVSKGWTALDFAVQRHDMQLAKILFRAGASPLNMSCGGKYTTTLQYCMAEEPSFYKKFVAAYYDE